MTTTTQPVIDTATIEMPIEVRSPGGSIECGFRVDWISADSEGIEADLMAGAGVGSPYMILNIKRDGLPDVIETVDMRQVLGGWIDAAIERAETNQ